MVYLGAVKRIKDAIITGLRAFFNNPDNYAHLLPRQLSRDVFTNMIIFDSFAEQLTKFPMIVVSNSSGRMIAGGISNDFASEVYAKDGTVEGYLYGGMYEFNIEVEIGTKTTLEREVLMDITTSALRFSLRRRLEYYGVIIKEMSYGGENATPYNSDMIYTSTMTMQTYSEWYDYYRLLPVKAIRGNSAMLSPQNSLINQSNATNDSQFNISFNTDMDN